VTIDCRGKAASMGSILLQAGTKGCRKISRFSWVLVHEVRGQAGYETTSDSRVTQQFKEALWDQCATIIAENSNLTFEMVKDKGDRDWWITAKEAVEFGLADELV
jgi:ATP-dependent Clp protease, protease subunit